MFKSLGFVLICITATLAGTGGYAAMNNNALQLGITIEYELPPFDPQLFSNYSFLTVEAKCRISTKDDSNLLHAVALAKKGKLNDIPWSKGDELDLIVHNDENIKIYALPGAQVEITNKGEHTLKAICTS